MRLATLTCALSRRSVAIDPELVGEVRDLEGKNRTGRTRIVHKRNRRVWWEVCEAFDVVMDRLQGAATPSPETAGTVTPAADRPQDPRENPGSGGKIPDHAAHTWALLVERCRQLDSAAPVTVSRDLILWADERMSGPTIERRKTVSRDTGTEAR